MHNRLLSPTQLTQYNSFYTKPDCRKIIYELFRGTCQATGASISFEDAHVGHIVPRSQKNYFESLFPELDVDNIINLFLINRKDNIRNSSFTFTNSHFLGERFNHNSRLIQQRLHKILSNNKQDMQVIVNGFGTEATYDFSEAYEQGFDFQTFHCLDAEKVFQTIYATFQKIDSGIAYDKEELDRFIYQTYCETGYILSNKYSQTANEEYSSCIPHKEKNWMYYVLGKDDKKGETFSYEKGPITHLGLPAGRWLFLKGSVGDAQRMKTFTKFTQYERVLLSLFELYQDISVAIKNTSPKKQYIQLPSQFHYRIEKHQSSIHKNCTLAIKPIDHVLIEAGQLSMGSGRLWQEIEAKQFPAKFSGYIHRRKDLLSLRRKAKKCFSEQCKLSKHII